MKRILLVTIPVIAWLSVSGYLMLGYGNQASTAANQPTITQQTVPVVPSYSQSNYSPPTFSLPASTYYSDTATNPPTNENSPQSVPTAPRYSPPTYSPPTSSYSDYSPAWSYSNSDVDVRGYYRKDGTYVKPYSRTKPDGIKSNNYGYPGNYNPNTGKISK